MITYGFLFGTQYALFKLVLRPCIADDEVHNIPIIAKFIKAFGGTMRIFFISSFKVCNGRFVKKSNEPIKSSIIFCPNVEFS